MSALAGCPMKPTEPDEYILTNEQWLAVRPLFEGFDDDECEGKRE